MPQRIVLIKHAKPVMDSSKPPKEWVLSDEGEHQSERLSSSLGSFAPLRLVSSPEPKALRTSEIVANALGIAMTCVEDLREFDRPALPILSPDEHERLNTRLFAEFDSRVIGAESAREARDRFAGAVVEELVKADGDNLAVVAHGTVISLLVSKYNQTDPFELWKRLRCPSFVVLESPSFSLMEIVAEAGADGPECAILRSATARLSALRNVGLCGAGLRARS